MSDQQTARVARRLTQHERARVWERVVAERAKGDGWRDIAERAALSERQCRRIYLAHARSAPTLEPSALEREIEDTVAFYDQAISDLAVISMTTRSEVARVAAIKARIATRARKLELLRVAGALDSARKEIDVRAVANAVVQAFDEHNVGDDARRAVLAALRAGHPTAEHHQIAAYTEAVSAVRAPPAPACSTP